MGSLFRSPKFPWDHSVGLKDSRVSICDVLLLGVLFIVWIIQAVIMPVTVLVRVPFIHAYNSPLLFFMQQCNVNEIFFI